MLRSKTFLLFFGIGAMLLLLASKFGLLNSAPCTSGSIILGVDQSLLPCPSSPPATPLADATKKAVLMLIAPRGTVRVGDSFSLTLELDATGTAVNAVDVTIAYPASLAQLTAKDETVTPFAIRLGGQTPDLLAETIQVQPSPGIESLTPLARFRSRPSGSERPQSRSRRHRRCWRMTAMAPMCWDRFRMPR